MTTVTDPSFNPSGDDRVVAVKEAYALLEQVVMANCPTGRRRSVALTELETSAMWAVKSIFQP